MIEAAGDDRRDTHRLRYLDGLRGWAALVVVIFHSTWELFKGYWPAVRTAKLGLFNDGKLAVFVFFVLSGLVLSYPYLSTMRLEVVTKLALRRYLRLAVPIAVASFVAYLMLKWGVLYHKQANAIVRSDDWLGTFYPFAASFAGWLKFATYDVFFRYSTERSYDIVLWTMPYELAGSFLIFAILAISGRSLAARIVAYVAAAFLCRAEAPILLGFVLGAVIAELMISPLWSRAKGAWANIAGSTLILMAFAGSVLLRSVYSPQRCAALACAIVLGVILSGFWRRLLETRLSQWLGRISFPLYVTHTLVLFGPGCALVIWLSDHGVAGATLVAIVAGFVIGVSLLVATLFYPIERMAIRTSHAFSRVILDARLSAGSWLRSESRPPAAP